MIRNTEDFYIIVFFYCWGWIIIWQEENCWIKVKYDFQDVLDSIQYRTFSLFDKYPTETKWSAQINLAPHVILVTFTGPIISQEFSWKVLCNLVLTVNCTNILLWLVIWFMGWGLPYYVCDSSVCVSSGGQRRSSGLWGLIYMEVGWGNQLGNWLRYEEQARRLHSHHTVTQLDPQTDGGQYMASCVLFQDVPLQKNQGLYSHSILRLKVAPNLWFRRNFFTKTGSQVVMCCR